MKDENRVIIGSLIIVLIVIGGSFLIGHLLSVSLLKILNVWLTFGALTALWIGIEKMCESEFGAGMVFMGAVAAYIIYCFI